jgi:putative addiction module component (TIGR02574 family)
MSAKHVLSEALKLTPAERLLVVEGLIESLDQPDPSIAAAWAEEAELRLQAYRESRRAGVPLEEVFRDGPSEAVGSAGQSAGWP